MDNELEQLEAELKRLEPATVSPEATARVASELARPMATRPAAEIRWIWGVALAAAAAIAIILTLVTSQRAPRAVEGATVVTTAVPSPETAAGVSDQTELKPVADESVLVSARDEGLVTLDDGTQARRERLQFVETITWKNPRTNASLIWSMPREEVRVVPISFQ